MDRSRLRPASPLTCVHAVADPEPLAIPLVLNCQECFRRWQNPSERWRVYLTDGEPPAAVLYCPECARREFED